MFCIIIHWVLSMRKLKDLFKTYSNTRHNKLHNLWIFKYFLFQSETTGLTSILSQPPLFSQLVRGVLRPMNSWGRVWVNNSLHSGLEYCVSARESRTVVKDRWCYPVWGIINNTSLCSSESFLIIIFHRANCDHTWLSGANPTYAAVCCWKRISLPLSRDRTLGWHSSQPVCDI